MLIKNSKVLKELNAYIDQAWGKEKFPGEKDGFSIKHDPALARNLEWIRDCYEELYGRVGDFYEDYY
jgi:hypothetical protein